MVSSLNEHGRARDLLLQRIVEVLEGDPLVVAAWLTGSLALETADEWSDLDLHVAFADEHYEAALEGRRELYERFGRPVLVQEIKVNTENPAHFNLLIYPGGLEVDCTLWTLRLAHRAPWSRLLFDRAGVPVDEVQPETEEERRREAQHQLNFFWAMAVVGMKTVGRGYTSGAALTIDLMTSPFDCLWRLLYRPDEPHPEAMTYRHRRRIPELEAITPRLGRTIDPEKALAVMRGLCREVERLHGDLRRLGVEIPEEMPAEVAALGKLAEEISLGPE